MYIHKDIAKQNNYENDIMFSQTGKQNQWPTASVAIL